MRSNGRCSDGLMLDLEQALQLYILHRHRLLKFSSHVVKIQRSTMPHPQNTLFD